MTLALSNRFVAEPVGVNDALTAFRRMPQITIEFATRVAAVVGPVGDPVPVLIAPAHRSNDRSVGNPVYCNTSTWRNAADAVIVAVTTLLALPGVFNATANCTSIAELGDEIRGRIFHDDSAVSDILLIATADPDSHDAITISALPDEWFAPVVDREVAVVSLPESATLTKLKAIYGFCTVAMSTKPINCVMVSPRAVA